MDSEVRALDESVAEALEAVPKQTATQQKAAPAKKSKRPAGSRYADYAPAKFTRNPAAKTINVLVDMKWTREAGDPGAEEVELGEALTAAAYWALGLPPTDLRDGDGHPYIVAATRTMKFAQPRVMRAPWFKRMFQAFTAKKEVAR